MDCPTCGKSLSTERGMRQHHTKVHGDPLPNRTCEGCGTEFYDEKARQKYCDDCDPNAGEHNGNWKDAKETAECQRCGSEFEYYPSDKDGVYCPECVEAADDFLGEHYRDVHDIESEQRECEHCGDTFSILPCNIRAGGGRFCSHDCLSAGLSEEWGDGTAVYNGDWYPVKRQVLARDNHQCQYCGKEKEDIGREPDVHHITPVREFDDPQEAHTLDNLVALCPKCHSNAEWGNIPDSDIRPRDAEKSRNQ
ncbi:HNH endonuclease [Halomicrobium salinisoli]|uniref:HNH endonuclease n=1 Tax=Halomicrobium salinisoli TaxID=2878391 RepID=UPI001CF09EF9|nr:HNH endonuclease signature motif containing protein [Halomicrobium salinisoli]